MRWAAPGVIINIRGGLRYSLQPVFVFFCAQSELVAQLLGQREILGYIHHLVAEFQLESTFVSRKRGRPVL